LELYHKGSPTNFPRHLLALSW